MKEMAEEYKSIYHQFAQAVKYADNKCHKIFPDAVNFSPEV